ncbi:MAG: 50S ribosomal protein L3 [Spirochaetaceae bacterium]
MIGLIGRKIGMTQVFDETGRLVPVTVIQVEPNVVVGRRTPEKDGYSAVILGAEEAKPQGLTKPLRGQYEKAGVAPQKKMMEVADFDHECTPGDTLGVDLFADAGFVDVIGTSKGKGFQGVMKRHGFGGGRKTHGSKFHRANGSTGMAAWPSRVIKGTRMPGRMGGERSTVQNLRVVRVDAEKRMLLVGGAVPGARNGYVLVSTAKKR